MGLGEEGLKKKKSILGKKNFGYFGARWHAKTATAKLWTNTKLLVHNFAKKEEVFISSLLKKESAEIESAQAI